MPWAPRLVVLWPERRGLLAGGEAMGMVPLLRFVGDEAVEDPPREAAVDEESPTQVLLLVGEAQRRWPSASFSSPRR